MPTSLQYHRLRTPRENGQTLQDPPLKSAMKLLRDNLQIERAKVAVDEISLTELSQLGRREVFDLACQYTSQYRDVSSWLGQDKLPHVVMSGHQPKLFHPGVWYKNFALSALGESLNCLPINLVVDNDICGVASILLPETRDGEAAFSGLPIDGPGDNIPFESRRIGDTNVFDSFAKRVVAAMKRFVDQPLVNELWKNAIEFRQRDNRLGQTLASSRHAMELDFGLNTLEIPVSQVAQTRAFAHFAKHLLSNLAVFQKIHNDSLAEYRRVHKIRSRSHPVPPLESDGPWLEAPLWIWDVNQPLRGRLFAHVRNEQISLTDRHGIEISIDRASFVDQFAELTTSQGIAVRPRALVTTMFGRMVLSDLFLHGIGGAKYDQLTDEIIERFLGLSPPRFLTLTATMKLPTDSEIVQFADVTRIDNQLRELTFHPEAHLFNRDQAADDIARQKQAWIDREFPKGNRLERHRNIVRCNELLQPYVVEQHEQLLASQLETVKKIRTGNVLGSREFSFCLFPTDLMFDLKNLAR